MWIVSIFKVNLNRLGPNTWSQYNIHAASSLSKLQSILQRHSVGDDITVQTPSNTF
jgi:hypothetical protein